MAISLVLFSSITYAQLLLVTDQEQSSFQGLLESNGIAYTPYSTLDEALTRATIGDGLMILTTESVGRGAVSKQQVQKMKDKNLKVYIEYPNYVESNRPEIKKINLERGVISTDTIPDVSPMSIVTLNDQYFYQYVHPHPIMAIAKVAGFDKAEYGLAETINYPGIFQIGRASCRERV